MPVPNRRQFLTATAALPVVHAFGCTGRTDHSATTTAEDKVEPEAKGPPFPIAESNNAFGCDLYGRLKLAQGNVFFSPFSIEAALGMTSAGAKGNTLVEMQKVLHLPAGEENVHGGFKAMIASLNNDKVPIDKRGYELTIANALWGMTGFPWRKEFLATTNANYGAGLIDTDFGQPEVARGIINKWVEQKTREKIKDLIPKGLLTPDTRMVLTNAIYFKGSWATEFDKKQTKVGPFHLADGTEQDAPLMYRHADMSYAETADYQVIELPYKGQETAMLVWLPRKADGFADLETKLSAKSIADTVKALTPGTDVELTLPKFKVETEYSMGEPLTALGMKDAFDENKADLSGMHSGGGKLFISAVVHKAFVDVNEEGTEAAAATAVVIMWTSARVPAEPKVFRADRPFLFAIRHLPTGAVLFLGRVSRMK